MGALNKLELHRRSSEVASLRIENTHRLSRDTSLMFFIGSARVVRKASVFTPFKMAERPGLATQGCAPPSPEGKESDCSVLTVLSHPDGEEAVLSCWITGLCPVGTGKSQEPEASGASWGQ